MKKTEKLADLIRFCSRGEMLTEFSGLLNRLSGMADEMSSYFRKMKELREEEPDKKIKDLL
jgi:hypothetical protein